MEHHKNNYKINRNVDESKINRDIDIKESINMLVRMTRNTSDTSEINSINVSVCAE